MLVVNDELAYRLRELATLPPALESTRGLGRKTAGSTLRASSTSQASWTTTLGPP